MTPVSTHKGSRRHHYYVTRLKPGEDKELAWRVPAGEIDSAAIEAITGWLRSHERPCEPGQLMVPTTMHEQVTPICCICTSHGNIETFSRKRN